MVDLTVLAALPREEFADIVVVVRHIDAMLRIILSDESYIDFWCSEVQDGRFVHHCNRQHVDGTLHRHDNSPYRKWQHIPTFPHHYRREQEETVTESVLPQESHEAVRAFLSTPHHKKGVEIRHRLYMTGRIPPLICGTQY
jgi:hypothetical protein